MLPFSFQLWKSMYDREIKCIFLSFLESTSFRSPSSGSGSSGIGSSSSSTSGGPNLNSPGNVTANMPGHSRVKTPRSHQDDSEESGVGHEEDEEMQQLLVELLSLIRTPKVKIQSESNFVLFGVSKWHFSVLCKWTNVDVWRGNFLMTVASWVEVKAKLYF